MTVVSAKTPSERTCALDVALKVLRAGGVIAYPTETVYGLGCDPRNAKAVARIFRMKGREKGKPVLLVASSVNQIRKFVGAIHELPLRTRFHDLAKRYWPGPLTIVLPISTGTEGGGIASRGEIAIRVSSHPFVHALTSRFGFPIVSTSANRSGHLPSRSVRAILKAFDGRSAPDLVIDGGTLPKRAPSTVVRIRKDGSTEILRQGSVKIPLL